MSEDDQKENIEVVSVQERRDADAETSDVDKVCSPFTRRGSIVTRPSRLYFDTPEIADTMYFQDEFEDANDTASAEEPVNDSIEGTRSLTQRPSSSMKSPSEETTHPVPTIPIATDNADKENSPLAEPHTIHVEDERDHTEQAKSPLLTAHRMSTESLDNVNLDEDGSPGHEVPPKGNSSCRNRSGITSNSITTVEDSKQAPALPPKNTKGPLQGLSGVLPSIPWSPPPQPPPPTTSLPAPAPPTRKLTSPFAWLTRNTSSQPKESVMSPPLPSPGNERRNTASSIATVGSNPEMMLSKLEEGHEHETSNGNKRPARNSLRDRFKIARMREEAGISSLPEDEKAATGFAGLMSRGGASLGLGLASPSNSEDRDLSLGVHSPMSPHPPSPNPALAPGTASGVSAGPSAMSDSVVDWDLWQAVVDEGPTAVARTSPDELNRAIATGIPNAIRGVVWQILASSKNEELESVYRELVNRGTDKDKDRMSGSSGAHSIHSNGREKDDVIISSASSIHSDHSTPATTITNGLRSPSPPKDPDVLAKAQAVSMTLKKKKAKEDAASLAKLEKAIRRDLGARTSFSKFAASAGMQESLFGVCKAYALFDEGVGYAQGMTFLVSPLLFNVSNFHEHLFTSLTQFSCLKKRPSACLCAL